MFKRTALCPASKNCTIATKKANQKAKAKRIKKERKMKKKASKVISIIAKQINKEAKKGGFYCLFHWSKTSPWCMGLHYRTWMNVAPYVEPILKNAGYSVSTKWHDGMTLYHGKIGNLYIAWKYAEE